MQNPFVYGQVVTGAAFTNRQKEKKQLADNIRNGIHTIIISPRRWGKSSLVAEVSNELEKKKIVVPVRIDLSTIIDERDFFSRYAKAVLKISYTKVEEILEFLKNAFKSIKPSIAIESLDNSFSLGVNFSHKDVEQGFEDILNLPQLVAKKRNVRLLVTFDEFQNVANFNNPEIFQAQLRSVLQYHKNVSYVFFGSRKHMMEDIFHSKSAPFYNFGDVIWLKKISEEDFIPFLMEKFESTGKKISEDKVRTILRLMDYNPQYVQLLANKIWDNSERKITDKAIEEAVETVLMQYEDFFQNAFEDLTRHQKNFLFGLLKNDDDTIFSAKFISRNELGSSANVERVKSSLIKKDLIDFNDGTASFIDPAFRLWLERKID